MSAPAVSSSFTKFEHTPLDLEKTQIRLLCIYQLSANKIRQACKSGACVDTTGLISCELEVFDCNDPLLPQYNALSYAWGPKFLTCDILLNGKLFTIRENLWHFLSYYAGALVQAKSALWWIDQLCINQQATDEKNHQVRLMSKIYKDAFEVVSWLGREEHDAPLVAKLIKPPPRHYGGREVPRLNLSDTELEAFRKFFSRPYWTRLWVIQEIMLAKKWTLLCGKYLYNGTEVIAVVKQLENHEQDPVLPVLWIGAKWRFDFRGHPPQLVTCLINFGHLRSEKAHDKVYAMLGLAVDSAAISVDYALTPTDVFWMTMESFQANEIIDPSGIVRLAYDMGIIDESYIIKDKPLYYMSIGNIKSALKQKLPIVCTPNVLDPIEAQRLILDKRQSNPDYRATRDTFKNST